MISKKLLITLANIVTEQDDPESSRLVRFGTAMVFVRQWNKEFIPSSALPR